MCAEIDCEQVLFCFSNFRLFVKHLFWMPSIWQGRSNSSRALNQPNIIFFFPLLICFRLLLLAVTTPPAAATTTSILIQNTISKIFYCSVFVACSVCFFLIFTKYDEIFHSHQLWKISQINWIRSKYHVAKF